MTNLPNNSSNHSSKPHILLFTRPIAPPWDEASKNFAFSLASGLPDFNFHLLTPTPLPHELKKANFKEHQIYTSSNHRLSFWQQTRLLIFLLFFIPLEVDILHSLFTPRPFTNFLIKSFILPFNNLWRQIKNRPPLKTIQSLTTLPLDQLNTKNIHHFVFADKVITYSKTAQEKLAKLDVTTTTIYPGIDLNQFFLAPKKTVLLNQYGLNLEDKIILYTGEFARLKALPTIIYTFIKLAPKYPQLKLILACRIKSNKDLIKRQWAQAKLKAKNLLNRVVFIETFSPMVDLYNLADIFIFPAKNMTGKFDIALTVLEALACGKPTILSTVGSLKEVEQLPNSVRFISWVDSQKLSPIIAELLENPELAQNLGQKGRQNIEQYFNLENTLKNYEKIYQELSHQ